MDRWNTYYVSPPSQSSAPVGSEFRALHGGSPSVVPDGAVKGADHSLQEVQRHLRQLNRRLSLLEQEANDDKADWAAEDSRCAYEEDTLLRRLSRVNDVLDHLYADDVLPQRSSFLTPQRPTTAWGAAVRGESRAIHELKQRLWELEEEEANLRAALRRATRRANDALVGEYCRGRAHLPLYHDRPVSAHEGVSEEIYGENADRRAAGVHASPPFTRPAPPSASPHLATTTPSQLACGTRDRTRRSTRPPIRVLHPYEAVEDPDDATEAEREQACCTSPRTTPLPDRRVASNLHRTSPPLWCLPTDTAGAAATMDPLRTPAPAMASVSANAPYYPSLPFKRLHDALLRQPPRMEEITDLITHDRGVLDEVDQDGNTALHVACSTRPPSTAVVSLLLQAGAHLHVQNRSGLTPFHVACLNQSDTMNRLREYLVFTAGCDVNERTSSGETAAHLLADDDHNVPAMRFLLRAGADLSARSYLYGDWRTPKEVAQLAGEQRTAKLRQLL